METFKIEQDGSKIIDFVEKAKQKKEEKKEKLPPIENLWTTHILKTDEYGVELDCNKSPILYHFNKNEKYWKLMSDDELIKQITIFINTNYPNLYTQKNVKNCKDITTHHIFSFGRVLQKSDEFIISTTNHILKILPDFKIEALDKTEYSSTIKKYFTRIHLPISLNFDTRYYIPKSSEKIEEEDTLFSKLLKFGLPKIENRRAFQEFFGDTLNPQLRKAFPIMIGNPNGGKSQFLQLLSNFHQNSTTIDLEKDGFGLSQVIGSSLVLVDEIGKNPSTKKIKQLVGGSILAIERKYKSDAVIQPDFKIFGADNGLFKNYNKNDDDAIKTRFYLFKIEDVKKENRIDQIALKISKNEEEMRNVLDWALNGAMRVLKRGRILYQNELPQDSKILMENFEKDSSPFINFVEDVELTFDENKLITKMELYNTFKKWCENVGNYNFSKISFEVFIRDHFNKNIDLIKNYDKMLERRIIDENGKKVFAVPLQLKNAPELFVKNVDKQEVNRSLFDENSYVGKIPPKIFEIIKEKTEKMKIMLNLNKEQAQQFLENELVNSGFKKGKDGSWEKGDDINF